MTDYLPVYARKISSFYTFLSGRCEFSLKIIDIYDGGDNMFGPVRQYMLQVYEYNHRVYPYPALLLEIEEKVITSISSTDKSDVFCPESREQNF